MKLSANEVTTLATKAARGGGAPPAQAADFGRAALCHLIADRPSAALSAALNALPEGAILSLPLAFGHLIETAKGDEASGTLPVACDPELVLSYAQSQPFAANTEMRDATLTITLSLTNPNPPQPVARVTLPDALYTQMQTLAARLLVPESAASRLSGAGAGLTDND